MKLVSGDFFWTNINKIPNKYTYLSEDINCEVAVIGGGITGALTSYYLSMSGIDTVLLEKNIIGYTSTRASTSILQYEIDSNILDLRDMYGINKAVRAFKLCEEAYYDVEKIVGEFEDDCGFMKGECLYYSSSIMDVAKLKEEYILRKENGFDVELLDEESAKDKFAFKIKAGIYSRSAAGGIDPYRFTHSLIEHGLKNKLKVFENTEVTNIEPGDEVIITTVNGFKVKAKRVVIAPGYDIGKYIDRKLATFSRSFTIVTNPQREVEGWYNRCIIRDTSKNYTYLRPTVDGRIIIGGKDKHVGGEKSRMANLTNSDKAAVGQYEKLEKDLNTLFPGINNLKIDYKFSGIFGDTKDGLPYIGEYEAMPNCYFNLGYGGNGILYAVIGGKLIRDMYKGKKSSDADLFSLNR